MSLTRLNETEPAILAGGIVATLGSLALLGADVSTLQALGTGLGISGAQGLLTRPFVYSPKAVGELRDGDVQGAALAGLLTPRGGFARQREPAMAIGLATLMGGFLVQFFTGVGLTEALASATGIAGVQGVATRSQVNSPTTARGAALAGYAANELTVEQQQEALAIAAPPRRA